MRIGFITTAFDEHRGGSGVFGGLFRRLCRRHSITIVAHRVLDDPAWQAVHVPSRSSHTLLWYTERYFAKAAVARVRELHREQPFDIIIVNQVIGPAIADLRSLGVPVVYVIHHPVSVDMALTGAESASLRERLRWRLAYGRMASIQRGLAHTFDTLLTVSESARDRISADYSVSREKISVIHNGIDTSFFRRTREREPKTVIALGSYQHPRRGFRYLVEAYRRLSAKGYTILDVGRRTDEQDAVIRAIPGVIMFELARHSMLPDLYSRASVSISTSLYEGFGLALVESLACETPCVAFAAGGAADVLGVIDRSLLCEIGNVTQMVDRVASLESSADGPRYRQAVIEHFDSARMERDYEALFTRMIARPAEKLY